MKLMKKLLVGAVLFIAIELVVFFSFARIVADATCDRLHNEVTRAASQLDGVQLNLDLIALMPEGDARNNRIEACKKQFHAVDQCFLDIWWLHNSLIIQKRRYPLIMGGITEKLLELNEREIIIESKRDGLNALKTKIGAS